MDGTFKTDMQYFSSQDTGTLSDSKPETSTVLVMETSMLLVTSQENGINASEVQLFNKFWLQLQTTLPNTVTDTEVCQSVHSDAKRLL